MLIWGVKIGQAALYTRDLELTYASLSNYKQNLFLRQVVVGRKNMEIGILPGD